VQPSANPVSLDDPALYINRDLSWLEFNRRVLEEAQDPSVAMLERLKFLAIFSSNLDEFYMVRVGNIQQKVQANIPIGSGADQMSPRLQLEQVRETTRELVAEQYRVLREEVLPALAARGIVVRSADQLTDAERNHVRGVFLREIFPVLTPLATDPAHPFPHLLNKSLNLAVTLRRPNDADPIYAVVQVPGVLPRFLPLPGPKEAGTSILGSGIIRRPDLPEVARAPSVNGDVASLSPTHAFLPLEEAIRLHLGELFAGLEIGGAVVFRVTRDSEYELDDEVDDLLEEIEAHVKARRRGHPVRLEIEAGAPTDVQQFLTDGLRLNAADVCPTPGLIDLTGLFQI
jgi:polyphosphate kinase